MDNRKFTPLGDRTLVRSRGIKEEMEGGLIVPTKFLRNSDVCSTDDGRTVIVRSHSEKGIRGREISDGVWIVENKNILAEITEGCIIPHGTNVYARKCKDIFDGIERVGGRENQFVEVLAAGCDTEGVAGYLGYVEETALSIQKVEDTIDDWLIDERDVKFYVVN